VPPDFLNSREDAALIWSALIVGLFLFRYPRAFGVPLLNIGLTLIKPPLGILFAAVGIYCAGVVVLGAELGLWHTTALRETVYWFIGTAAVLAAHATLETPGPDYVRKILVRAFKVTILVEFLVNLYVFPLAAELVFIPLVGFFIVMDAYAKAGPDVDPSVGEFIDGGLVAIGWLVLVTAGLRVGLHVGQLATRENLERLLVVPALTVALIPFLYVVAWYSRQQVDRLGKRQQVDRLRKRFAAG
jgi:hypothetical protein